VDGFPFFLYGPFAVNFYIHQKIGAGMSTILYVFVGGGLGSLARYGVSKLMESVGYTHLPLATLLSNLLSCALLGVVLFFFQGKLHNSSWVSSLLLIGFCGGFSTFSTFSNETVQLVLNGQWLWAIANVLISVLLAFVVIYWIRIKMIA
jgi:fluoride exporter